MSSNYYFCLNSFLSAQYYSSAIAEIGLALLATSIVLNFHYRKNKMPSWLRKSIFSLLGPIVNLKKTKTQDKFLRRNTKRSDGNSNDKEHYVKGNCELKSLNLLQNDSVSNECESRNECQCGKNLNNIRETQILDDTDHNAGQEHRSRVEDHNDRENIDSNVIEWQQAARILDRFILLLAITVSVCTFAAIFIQAPRVKAQLFGHSIITIEEKLGIGRK
jgi:hypothetical protein